MDNTQVPMPNEIREFLEKLLIEAKITPENEDLKQGMLSDLYERLQTRILQVLAEHMDAPDLDEYTKLANEDQLKAAQFLQTKYNNMPQYMAEAMAEFRQTFLS